METIRLFLSQIPAWLYLPIIYGIWVVSLITLKKLVLFWMLKASKRTPARFYEMAISAIDFPLTLLILGIGGLLIPHLMPHLVIKAKTTTYLLIFFRAVSIVAIYLFLDRLLRQVTREYGRRFEFLRSSGGILQTFVRAAVVLLTGLVLLDTFGISITPFVASLGLTSLAVALALQPTLENFFSGIQLLSDNMIEVGHFVRLEWGEEGVVEKIGWRSTWIRLSSDNMLIVPNKTLQNSRVLNYYYPHRQLSIPVTVSVAHDSDLGRIEAVTLEVAESVRSHFSKKTDTLKSAFYFHTIGPGSIGFTVVLRADQSYDQPALKHEFIKRLHDRYRHEGITIK